jgi:hypothetical protein
VRLSCIALVCEFLKKSRQSLAHDAFRPFRALDRVGTFANSFPVASYPKAKHLRKYLRRNDYAHLYG